MYRGHVVLLSELAIVLLLAWRFQGRKKLAFPIVSLIIAVFFTYVSIQYYFDVFHNPGTDGFLLTWTMYLLAQHEDFLSRNGHYFGLVWGVGITAVSLMLAGLSYAYARSKRTE